MLVKVGSKHLNIRSDEERFSDILHPKWCSLADHKLLQARGRGESFAIVAKELQRPTRAIEQRFHQLRVVRGIEELLLRHGLMDRPYDLAQPVTLRKMEAAQ